MKKPQLNKISVKAKLAFTGHRGKTSRFALILMALIIALGNSINIANACNIPDQPGAISGNDTVCYKSSQTYSVNPVSGATSYGWTLPSGWSGSSTTNSITLTAGISSGTLFVVAKDSCGSSTSSSLNIVSNNTPVRPGIISGATSVCTGSSQVYGIVPVTGATSYSWILPSAWSGSSTTNSITATADSAGGSISVSANNACGSSASYQLFVSLRLPPTQPGSIQGRASICSSSAHSYVINPVQGAVSYTWSLPDGWSGYSGTNLINLVAGSAGGNISVTANNGCGSSAATTLAVTVNSVTAAPSVILGNNSSCSGASEQYIAATVIGATGYTWHLPTGWSGSSTTNSIFTTTGNSNGNVSVVANNGCGSSVARSFSVAINNVPPKPGTITGAISACVNSSQTYSVRAVSGATSYTWSLPSDWTGNSDSSSILVTTGTAAGTISVQANNNCGSSITQSINVIATSAAPSPVSAISGNTSTCLNSSQTYSVTPVAGATSYIWSLPSGWSGTSTTYSITAKAGSSLGNISVTTNNNCGSDAGRTLAVTGGSAPATPLAITVSAGSAAVCPGDTRTYVVPFVSGLTYNWTVPAGLTPISGQGTDSILVTFSNSFTTSAVLSVNASNSCGTSAERSISIARNIPATPGPIIVSGGTVNVCPGDARSFSVTNVPGLTYNWTAPIGVTITSGQGTHSIVVHFTNAFTGPGTLKVNASNACSTGNSSSLSILRNIPVAPGTISITGGANKVCPGDLRIYRVTAVAGMTYNWTAPIGANITAGQGTNSVSLSFDSTFTASGYIQVTATNTCSTGPASGLLIPLNTPAMPGPISGINSVCAGSTMVYLISAVANASSYIWTAPSGATISSGQGTNKVSVLWSTGAGALTVASTNGCGSSSVRNDSVRMTCREAENLSGTNLPNSNVQVFPNPSSGNTNVQFNSPSVESYSIHIMDITGRETEVKKGAAIEGLNTIDLDLNSYTKGMYFIRLQSGSIEELIKLMIE